VFPKITFCSSSEKHEKLSKSTLAEIARSEA
jgi:hypothetical protein